jgi:uncharacterized protein DUF1236
MVDSIGKRPPGGILRFAAADEHLLRWNLLERPHCRNIACGQALPLRPTYVGSEGISKGEHVMKKLLMATVATIALSAGGAWAAEPGAKAGAEMKGQAAGKAETTGSGAAAKSDADVKAGTEMKPSGTPKAKAEGPAKSEAPKARAESPAKSDAPKARSEMKGKSETTGSGSETKSGADVKGGASSKSQTTGAGSDSNKAAEPKAGTTSPTGAAGRNGQPSSSSPSTQTGSGSSTTTATTGSNTGAAVSLTNEQKTKIRTSVLQAGSAPKIERSQINFSLSVGTVVPRSIRVVTVPATLVEIHPAWRGYRYFVVGDEIIIVEPDTLRIVAVLTV